MNRNPDCINLQNDTTGNPVADKSSFSPLSFLQERIRIAGNG
jgi:hypothetical protein